MSPRRSRQTCAEPGCPKLTTRRRCTDHQREQYRRDTACYGTRHERGLGADHDRLRAQVLAEEHVCWRCGETREQVEARGDKLTAGHIISRAEGGPNIRANYHAECGRCNFGHGGGSKQSGVTPPHRNEPPTPPAFA